MPGNPAACAHKIVIIGKCSNSRGDEPLDLAGWEIWGLAWDPLPRCDRYFEMHHNWRILLGNADDAARHKAWLAGFSVPVMVIKDEPDIPE